MVPSLWSHFIIIASDSCSKDHTVGIFTPSCFSLPPSRFCCWCIFLFPALVSPHPSLSPSLFRLALLSPSPDSLSISKSRGHRGLSAAAWACRAGARSTLPGFSAINVLVCPSLRTWVFCLIWDISAKILQFAPNQSWSSLEMCTGSRAYLVDPDEVRGTVTNHSYLIK